MAIALLTIAGVAARAQERLPTIPPAQYTEEQKQAAADFEAARKVPVFGPFEPMMYSPQVMSQARAMGDYLRYKSAIGNRLSELVILITAHEWTQNYEWAVHYPIALKASIRKELADDIAVGRRPTLARSNVASETCLFLSSSLVKSNTVSSSRSRLGTKGVVDMTGQLHNADFADSAFHCGRKSSDDRRDQRNKIGEPIRWHHEQKHGDRKFGKVLLKR